MSCNYYLALTHCPLVFLSVYADSACSQVDCYITPSLIQSIHCPGDSCLTLAQFAANLTGYLSNRTNLSISFLSGNHSLDRELSLSHVTNFSMTKYRAIAGSGTVTVFVECDSQLQWEDSISATLHLLHKGSAFHWLWRQ